MAKIKNFLTPQWLREFEELKQSASFKRQASKASSSKRQARRHKPQASSPKQQAPLSENQETSEQV